MFISDFLSLSPESAYRREEGNTFAVFFQKKGWKGYIYSYVKIFS